MKWMKVNLANANNSEAYFRIEGIAYVVKGKTTEGRSVTEIAYSNAPQITISLSTPYKQVCKELGCDYED